MRLACSKFLVFMLAFCGVFAVAAQTAWAAGAITYSKTRIPEANGGWHLQMTIVYGGKPSLPHVPMTFKFTPVSFFESYLDDKHGDKPQKRTIPLVGQTPINESVDVGFSDPRGKIFDRTRFEFTITRAHNFAAGEYNVVVRRSDGVQIGGQQKLTLDGDNPVIDRRAISFVDSSTGKKDSKPAAAATAAPSGGESAPAESTPAAASESTPEPASSASAPSEEEAPDPTAAAKVPPGGSKGCGCRTVGGSASTSGAVLALGLVGVTFLRVRRRESRSRRMS
jgi:MYXO-CTERM domain-containing protein